MFRSLDKINFTARRSRIGNLIDARAIFLVTVECTRDRVDPLLVIDSPAEPFTIGAHAVDDADQALADFRIVEEGAELLRA